VHLHPVASTSRKSSPNTTNRSSSFSSSISTVFTLSPLTPNTVRRESTTTGCCTVCVVDDIDLILLAELQRDATQSYAHLGETVGLSSGAAHERVRKLRERGVIKRTTIEVDPQAVGRGVLAFVL